VTIGRSVNVIYYAEARTSSPKFLSCISLGAAPPQDSIQLVSQLLRKPCRWNICWVAYHSCRLYSPTAGSPRNSSLPILGSTYERLSLRCERDFSDILRQRETLLSTIQDSRIVEWHELDLFSPPQRKTHCISFGITVNDCLYPETGVPIVRLYWAVNKQIAPEAF